MFNKNVCKSKCVIYLFITPISRKIVSEMTYNVSSGTLNSTTIPSSERQRRAIIIIII